MEVKLKHLEWNQTAFSLFYLQCISDGTNFTRKVCPDASSNGEHTVPIFLYIKFKDVPTISWPNALRFSDHTWYSMNHGSKLITIS